MAAGQGMDRARLSAAVLLLVVPAAACTGDTVQSREPSATPGEAPSAPGAGPVAGDLEPFYAQELAWGRCEQRAVTLQCATLTVPLDYDDPTGATVDVALIRIEATGPDPVGSLVVNPGGPGTALVDAHWFPTGIVSQSMRSSYDIVGFDPRGTGRSGALDCLDQATRLLHEALDQTPDTPQEVAALDDADRAHAAACAEQAEGRLPYLGTEQVVHDLDVLRVALGDEHLHYLGYSYGTLLGSEYAARHPERTGRMALVSPVPAGRLDLLDWLHARALNAEKALDQAIGYCLGSPGCPLGDDHADARTRLETYLQELDENQPVELDGIGFTYAQALGGIESTLGRGPDGWGDLARVMGAAYRGHPSQLAGLTEPQSTDWPDANRAVLCLDRRQDPAAGDGEVDPAELASRWRAEAPVFGEPYAWLASRVCAGWPDPSFDPAPRPVDVHVLLVHSEGDPWSPPADADLMAGELPGAVRLAYAGGEHISYFASPCVREAVDRYLADGTDPDVDTCPAGAT